MEKVLITGGDGLVGRHLTDKLQANGYEVAVLSRSEKMSKKISYFKWNVEQQHIDPKAIENVSYIIHLAGAGIADKNWTKQRKREIISSRVDSAKLIYDQLPENHQVKAIISASGAGYYGAVTSDRIFTEEDESANDFLGDVCMQWETAIDTYKEKNIRTVKLRTGLVLSSSGGGLERMAKPFKLGFGAAIGSGKQYLPWIHIDDLCEMYLFAIQNDTVTGAYNAVVPTHITNREFSVALAKRLAKKIRLPNVPGFLLNLYLGEMAVLLLKGSRVSSQKIQDQGFKFHYTEIEKALENSLKK
jgi:uncharacterized protein (TIGR01777 family)